MLSRAAFLIRSAAVGLGAALARKAQVAHGRGSGPDPYPGPRSGPDSAYGFAAETFAKKLAELSGGTMQVRLFPNAALGKSLRCSRRFGLRYRFRAQRHGQHGDRRATGGVLSLHYIFRDAAHLEKAVMTRPSMTPSRK